MDGEGGKVMTADMTVKTVPTGKTFRLGSKPRLFQVRSEETVDIIFQEHIHVESLRFAETAVKQLHVAKRE